MLSRVVDPGVEQSSKVMNCNEINPSCEHIKHEYWFGSCKRLRRFLYLNHFQLIKLCLWRRLNGKLAKRVEWIKTNWMNLKKEKKRIKRVESAATKWNRAKRRHRQRGGREMGMNIRNIEHHEHLPYAGKFSLKNVVNDVLASKLYFKQSVRHDAIFKVANFTGN